MKTNNFAIILGNLNILLLCTSLWYIQKTIKSSKNFNIISLLMDCSYVKHCTKITVASIHKKISENRKCSKVNQIFKAKVCNVSGVYKIYRGEIYKTRKQQRKARYLPLKY